MRKPGSARSPRKPSADPLAAVVAGAVLAATGFAAIADEPPLTRYSVVGDAIPASLTGAAGDPARGRAIVLDRRLGACLMCHTAPFPEERFQGTLAPDLSGAGSRWSAGQLRLRLVDATRLDPGTIMPPYYRVDGLTRDGSAWRGKPMLTARSAEPVVQPMP
jgi:sulfur-oxidizing protein SoxX